MAGIYPNRTIPVHYCTVRLMLRLKQIQARAKSIQKASPHVHASKMIDYPFIHGKYQGIMASKMYKKTSYRNWAMEQDKLAGGLLKFQQYIIARRSGSSSTERPMTPNIAPPSPASNTAAPTYPATPSADLSLHDKMVLLERKVDALVELI